VLGGQRGRKLA